MAEQAAEGQCEPARRRWMAGRRRVRLYQCYSPGETAELAAAARGAGMAVAAFIARSALRAARAAAVPGAGSAGWEQREALAEFVRTSAQLRRAGNNLNQAVARLHSTGQADQDLAGYAAVVARIAGRLDELSAVITAAAR
jgi:hypothetical protein